MKALTSILLGATLAACALTDKAPPIDIRYFSPESVGVAATAGGESTVATSTSQVSQQRLTSRLRVGRITSGAHLRARIVFRASSFELGAYETLRWTENPEEYVRRSLLRALFEDRALSQIVSGPGPTLEVELVAFEEHRVGVERAGRVSLRYSLQGDREVIASGEITVERPAGEEGIVGVVAALAQALAAATDQLADTTLNALQRELTAAK